MIYRIAENNDRDVCELVKIRIAYLAEDFPLTEEAAEKIPQRLPSYFREHCGRDFYAFVAEESDAFVASAFLIVQEKPANMSFPTGKTGLVLNVVTLPQYRRQGISSALMKMLIEKARALELDFIELSASADGYPLYRKLGFSDRAKTPFTEMRLTF